MKLPAVLAVLLLAGCAAGGSSSERREGPGSVVVPKAFEVRVAPGQEDIDGRLEYWRLTVLDRVSRDSRPSLRAQVQVRLDLNVARDAELRNHPAGIAVERRLEIAREIAFETACLKLIDGK